MSQVVSTKQSYVGADGWIAVVLAVMVFLPPEFSANIGTVVIMPYRVVLLALFVPALLRLIAVQSLSVYDAAIAGFGFFALVSMIYNRGLDGIVSGGLAALETTGSYFVARAFLTRRGFDTFARVWIALGLVLLPLLLMESVLHQNIIHELAAALTGNPSAATSFAGVNGTERFGLFRVSGPFSHAILCGVAYAIFVPVLLFKGNAVSRAPVFLLLVFGILLSVSTDPILTFVVEIAAVFALWCVSRARWPSLVRSILVVVIPVFVVLQSFSNRGVFAVLASNIALDPWTGYYRTLVWHYGFENALAHPIFGLGYNDWSRPRWMVASVDAYWLLIAMRHGLVALTLYLGTCLAALGKMLNLYGRTASHDPIFRKEGAVWMAIFAGQMVSGITVDYWGAMSTLIPMLLGCGVTFYQRQAKLSGSTVRAPLGLRPAVPRSGGYRGAPRT